MELSEYIFELLREDNKLTPYRAQHQSYGAYRLVYQCLGRRIGCEMSGDVEVTEHTSCLSSTDLLDRDPANV